MFDNVLKFRSKQRTRYEEMPSVDGRWADTTRDQQMTVNRIPWRAICLATFLFVCGSVVMVVSLLTFLGYIDNIGPNDGILVLTLLGLLMFIPGFYHIRIAYHAYHGCHGFTFDDIPDFD